MQKAPLLFILFIVNFMAIGQSNFLKNMMESQPEKYGEILKNQAQYEVQILYTQIDRDKKNRPKFTEFSYNVNADHYFYPASTVKLPASILALEKVNSLKIKGLTKESTMITDADFEKHTAVTKDSTAENGLPSIAHYIKKILLVSDNDAFNRLYEFLGQKAFNEEMWKKGFKNSRFVHRLQTAMNVEQNKHTNPIRFFNGEKLVFKQNSQYNVENYFPELKIGKGKGYIGPNDKLINEPLDFTQKNKFALEDQHLFLKRLLFPNAFPKKERFNLSKTDYQFIYKYMSQLPTESTFPNYPKAEFWPSYCKFVLFGSDPKAELPNNIRIFNKVGDAYGFLLDNAYIVDYEADVEFLLSVVILCNNDQIFNDDKYDYDNIGFPFMENLGESLYEFEKNRPHKYKPNFEKMKFVYDK